MVRAPDEGNEVKTEHQTPVFIAPWQFKSAIGVLPVHPAQAVGQFLHDLRDK
jgi:D-alanine-D-alanine ligase-like ATP-grasp enzyme